MKLLKLTMAVLLVLCLTAVSAFSEVIWSEDFESYEAGTEIVGTVEGWKYFNPAEYSGTSTVVADGSGKVIKLSRVEEQSTNAYDMIFTPGIKLAPSEPLRQLTKISFSLKYGSKTDLFALYGIVGGATNRYFYMAFNGAEKKVSSSPSGVEFTNLVDSYNDCFVVVDYLNKKVVKIGVNGEEKDCDLACGDDVTEDVVLRLSTQYNSFISADEAAYFDNLQVETTPRSEVPVIYAPDSVTMGAKGKFTICNAGPDATINYTISTEADWLTINPTSGELTTVKDINLRCSQPRGFYKTTLTVDGGEYGSKEVKVICQNDVVYATTFEEFENGDITTQADEWTVGYGSTKVGVNEATVVDGGYDGSAKALRVHDDEDWFAPHINFTGTENHSSSNNFRVSFMLKVTNLGADIFFNNTDGLGEIALKATEGGCKIVAQNADFSTTNVCEYGVWFPISYVLNTTIGNKKLLEFQFGDCIYSNLDITITSETSNDRYKYFRFFLWPKGTDVLMDNFSLSYEPRQSVDNKISVTGTKTYDIFATNGTMRVFNEGSVDTEVTIESPYDFLTFGGETKVVTTVPANSYSDFEITLDRSSMGNDYYVNQIKVSNDTMTLYQPVMIQSGVEGEGYTFYKSYFDTLEEGIDIRELDPAWVTGYGAPPLCPITEKAGAKALALNYNAYNALHCTIQSPTGLSEEYNYRVSFMAYIPAGWDGTYYNYYVGFQTDGGTYFEQNLEGNADGFVTLSNMGNKPDLGKWFDVSYTFNILPSNEKHLETTFDGVTSNLNYNINFGDKDQLTYWRFFGWIRDDDAAAPIYLKDIVIEAVARPDSGPQLEVGRIGQIFYQDKDKDTELTVINSGKGNLSFSAEVTEGAGWLSIRAADPETGILEDTIEGTGSKKYTLDIDREALGNTYGLGKITVTGAGATEVADLYVQGYDDTGITFYYSDFEETPFGVINRVDPAWLHDLATVVEEDGTKCMKLQGGGGPLHCKVNVPDKLYDDYNFRVSCRVKVPREGVPQLTFGANRRQGEYTLNCNENSEVYFTIVDSDNHDAVSNTIPAGEWFDMSYTFNSDPLNRRTVSVQFGDEFYELDDPNTNPDCVDSYFEEFRFYIWDNAEPYFIDDFRIEAVGRPNIPPVMVTTLPNVPVSYTADEFEVIVRNGGGNSFHFTAAPGPGVDYLNVPTNTFEVKGAYRMTVKIDRSKLGYGFYRPTIRFSTDIEGQETVDVELPIQSGTPEEGYVIYASSFNALHTTKETDDQVVGELSDQDPCWLKCSSWNRADIVYDPAGSGNKVAKFINANDWVTYPGYQLNLGIPAEAAQDYDVVYSMDMYIPKTYVDNPESEHGSAAFFVSQAPGNRQCEVAFWLNEEQASLPVYIQPQDITTRDTWWTNRVETATPVESESWFRFYMRFSTKLVDFDHKNLWAITFGENEYQMEGEDSELTYPGGITEDQLDREDLTKLKLWSYSDNANICIDNVNILLVPKGLPEPAIFGILALLALAFARKQR
ncbi:hypothetical protein IKS38_00615 [bacterium]|nr:hypothetical protein [bacterium]